MDPTQVIHVGSFSKTLSPALRLGYVVADWAVMSRLVGLKRETDSGTGALEQMVVAEYFSQKFTEHVGELTGVLKEKLDTMVDALEREFGTTVEKMWRPKGGIFLWIKLPDKVDVTKLVAPAAKEGLVFNPGPEWSCNPAETEVAHAAVLCAAVERRDPQRRRDPGARLLRADRAPRAKRQHPPQPSGRLNRWRLYFAFRYTPPAFCSPRRSRKRRRRDSRQNPLLTGSSRLDLRNLVLA